jgi:hypothetical protein
MTSGTVIWFNPARYLIKTMRKLLLAAFVILAAIEVMATPPAAQITADGVMTAQEMDDTGISTLRPAQKQAFNAWLTKYTRRVINLTFKQNTEASSSSTVKTSCSPAVESTIAGDIEGWDGETIFKLDNGQIWQQAEYDYTYSYAYRPDVTIYPTTAGCRMKVEDESETVLVKRLK